MRLIRFPLVLLVLVSSCYCLPVFAWGAKGHRVIGALAQDYLTASTRASVNEILGGEDLATVSTWADEMRSAQDNPAFWAGKAATWHYVNIPPGETYEVSSKNPLGDAFMAIETFSAILRGDDIPAGPVREGLEFYFGDLQAHEMEVRRFALKFLVHLLGDMQQPVHSGYAHDRGGNAVVVSWFGATSNLHTVWDTSIIEHQGLSYTEMADRLGSRIEHTPAADIRVIERADPLAWIADAQQVLGRIYASHAASSELGYDYAYEYLPTVEAQLIKGGLRTAYVLNRLFGD